MPPAPPCWRCGGENHYGGLCPGDPMVQRIAALEAENATLREALEKISNRPLDGYIHTIALDALEG